MTFPQSINALMRGVSEAFASVSLARFGNQPVKVAAGAWDVTEPTARKMLGGELSKTLTPTFLTALASFSFRDRRKILRDLIGDMPEADEFEELREIRARLDRLASVRIERLSHAATGHGGGSLALAKAEGEGAGGGSGGGQDRGQMGLAEVDRSIALVSTRRPLAEIAGADFSELRRHLSAPLVTLDDARALVGSDNLRRTGLAVKRPGDDWPIYAAQDNRLWSPSSEGRPASAFRGDVVALRRDLDEAAASPEPVLIRHAGAFMQGAEVVPFNSMVVRMPGRSRCGASMVLTDFARVAA